MSKPTRWALVYAVLTAACATGGQGGGEPDAQPAAQDAATPGLDANTSVVVDAAIKLDAGLPMIDAYVPPPADASQGVFCQTNSQCTVAGECCVTLGGPNGFCAPGTVVLGQCVPQ